MVVFASVATGLIGHLVMFSCPLSFSKSLILASVCLILNKIKIFPASSLRSCSTVIMFVESMICMFAINFWSLVIWLRVERLVQASSQSQQTQQAFSNSLALMMFLYALYSTQKPLILRFYKLEVCECINQWMATVKNSCKANWDEAMQLCQPKAETPSPPKRKPAALAAASKRGRSKSRRRGKCDC